MCSLTDVRGSPDAFECSAGERISHIEGVGFVCVGCGTNTYSEHPRDLLCLPCVGCDAGTQYEALGCIKTRATVCVDCLLSCPAGQILQDDCSSAQRCRDALPPCDTDAEIEMVAGTATSDRVCVSRRSPDQCDACSSWRRADAVVVLAAADAAGFALARGAAEAAVGRLLPAVQAGAAVDFAVTVVGNGGQVVLSRRTVASVGDVSTLLAELGALPFVSATADVQALIDLADSQTGTTAVLAFVAGDVPPLTSPSGGSVSIRRAVLVGGVGAAAASSFAQWADDGEATEATTPEGAAEDGRAAGKATFCAQPAPELCMDGFYQTTSCSFSRPRECRPLTECTGPTTRAATATSDRECLECGAGSRLTAAGCEACAEGSFMAAAGQHSRTSCELHAPACILGQTWESIAPSAVRDRSCTPCSGPCATAFFETEACTPARDRQCAACRTRCDGDDEFLSGTCGGSEQPVCRPCKTCGAEGVARECTRAADTLCVGESDNDESSSSSSVSPGAIAGIVVAAVLLVALVLVRTQYRPGWCRDADSDVVVSRHAAGAHYGAHGDALDRGYLGRDGFALSPGTATRVAMSMNTSEEKGGDGGRRRGMLRRLSDRLFGSSRTESPQPRVRSVFPTTRQPKDGFGFDL